MADPSNIPPSRTEVMLPTCPVRLVVVYPDRAEVTREVKVQVDADVHEVVLQGVSKALDKDSVRVDTSEAASILEVSYSEQVATKDEVDNTESKTEATQLNDEKERLMAIQPTVVRKRARLVNEQELLEEYSRSLVAMGKQAKPGQLVDKDTVDDFLTFLDTYTTRSLKLKEGLFEVDREREELLEKLKKLDVRLRDLKPKGASAGSAEVTKVPVIGVMLSVKQRGEITLKVSYVVSNASWSPKYDLRVTSAQLTMEVGYFGMVRQNTGEDWEKAKLHLSTAAPSIAGSAPELSTRKLTLIHHDNIRRAKGGEGLRFNSKVLSKTASFRSAEGGGGGYRLEREGSITLDILTTPEANVAKGMTSSTFEISDTATVPSDNAAHKVTVATIDLKPVFEHETVPRLSQHAFLKATAKNESRYPLLAGPASVFLDQSFVTKTTIPIVSPQEEFSCSLGVDPSVKVVYKPLERRREESGLIAKTIVYKYRQVTEITNTRKEPAVVFFRDRIPLSRNSKLKVKLVEPVIAKPRAGAPPPNPALTASNHVTWTLNLSKMSTQQVVLQYTVEYPVNKMHQVEGL